jgi:hypothetical protein
MFIVFLSALIATVHLVAIVLGRKTKNRTEKTGFLSGLLGLFSFPVVLYFAIKSFCIAGMCRYTDNAALYVSVFVFVVLALLSAGTVVAMLAKRSRA